MPQKYALKLKEQGIGEEIDLAGEFSDKDWERLQDFEQYAEELMRTKFIQSQSAGSLRIESDPESGISFLPELPDWDLVESFLHKFRPILLESEDSSFYKIQSLLAKGISHENIRQFIRHQRDLFSGKIQQSGYKITSNEEVLNSEKVLTHWLNAYEYHRDKGKKTFIESLHQMFPLEASKVIFIRLLLDKAAAANKLAALIRVITGKQKTMTTR
jgi:hypothetical protein